MFPEFLYQLLHPHNHPVGGSYNKRNSFRLYKTKKKEEPSKSKQWRTSTYHQLSCGFTSSNNQLFI